ncbi:MAG: hydroxyacylglutathione hydrolase [Alphaproteobacteria bacterium]|nr:hydroxyacylglutathione hydrolase [Alphaproteobacteria bacterium]
MEHVVRTPREPFLVAGGALRVHQVPVWKDNLVWVIEGVDTGRAAVVDGPQAGPVLDYLAAHGLVLDTVLNTHTHGDHIGINAELVARDLLDGVRVVGPALAADAVPGITRAVDEGDVVDLFGVAAQVWRTEGHMDGHVSYVVPGAVFCGDTLFTGGCGYLFDGPPAKMFASLSRLAALPGDTAVCCAHEYTEDNLRFAWTVEPGNAALADRIRRVWAVRSAGGCAVPSTIDEERATNPFLRASVSEVARAVAAASSDPADSALAVFTATRRLKDTGKHKELPASKLPIGEPD